MLKAALFFFIVSVIAGVFGYTGIAVGAADIARILFFICIVIFIALLLAGLFLGGKLF
jgi:uncharacterized membrane protein YtjA (UPF0391 family)